MDHTLRRDLLFLVHCLYHCNFNICAAEGEHSGTFSKVCVCVCVYTMDYFTHSHFQVKTLTVTVI